VELQLDDAVETQGPQSATDPQGVLACFTHGLCPYSRVHLNHSTYSIGRTRRALHRKQKSYGKSGIKDLFPEVDHFFPHTLKAHGFSNIIDGVWNLVLSCQDCNRGEDGKFASVPSIKLLGRLHRRNEFLIASDHPLKETLIQQTGQSEQKRQEFLNTFHTKAWAVLIHTWETDEKDAPYF
jgi:hypothetical protein